MAAQLGQTLSDGSFWTLNLNITEPPSSDFSPPEVFLTIDLIINRTCRVVFEDEHENPICSEDFVLGQTLAPTSIHFPGTTTRAEFYSALHHRLERFVGDDVITNFTDHVIDRLNNLHERPPAIRVRADLRHVSLEYAPYVDDSVDQDDEIEEYEEEEKGLAEHIVRGLSDCCAVVAAEEHREVGDCSICLDGLFPVRDQGKRNLFGSPCGHFFHNECMAKWLRKSDSCPLCRFFMLSSAIDE